MEKYTCKDFRSADLQVLTHHIYEYKKGLRNLVLHTMNTSLEDRALFLLKKRNIPYYTTRVSDKKVNIFFGESASVEIVKSFGEVSLNQLTDEQDFILGTMLGYDRKQQCERYLQRLQQHLS